MSVVLRFDQEAGVVRSTGDPPNGVIGITDRERVAGFIVSPTFEPRANEVGPGVHVRSYVHEDPSLQAEQIDTDAVLAAIPTFEMAGALLAACVAIMGASAQPAALDGAFDLLRSYLDLAEQIRDRMVELAP